MKKQDSEIRLLKQQLEEIQDEVQKSRNSSQSQRSALDIFKQKYTSAMEKVQQLQVRVQRAEEEAELSQKQVVQCCKSSRCRAFYSKRRKTTHVSSLSFYRTYFPQSSLVHPSPKQPLNRDFSIFFVCVCYFRYVYVCYFSAKMIN